jgi:D-apionolactonase
MTRLQDGRLAAEIRDGALGAVTFDGVEVLRALTYPVRNADWGTHLTASEAEEAGATTYLRRFADTGGAFTGTFRVELGEGRVEAEVTFTFARAARVNRAGFTLLHPIRGVAGTPLAIREPDGRTVETAFPLRVSPAQPARNIAGMSHSVGGVRSGSPWRATSSRWRTSATGPTPRSRPTAARCRCRSPTTSRPARRSGSGSC